LFVGYRASFAVGDSFEDEFERIVNLHAEVLVMLGDMSQPEPDVAAIAMSTLRDAWFQLADDLLTPAGRLSRFPNSYLVGMCASVNALFAGAVP
jgi:hypothetical protein